MFTHYLLEVKVVVNSCSLSKKRHVVDIVNQLLGLIHLTKMIGVVKNSFYFFQACFIGLFSKYVFFKNSFIMMAQQQQPQPQPQPQRIKLRVQLLYCEEKGQQDLTSPTALDNASLNTEQGTTLTTNGTTTTTTTSTPTIASSHSNALHPNHRPWVSPILTQRLVPS